MISINIEAENEFALAVASYGGWELNSPCRGDFSRESPSFSILNILRSDFSFSSN